LAERPILTVKFQLAGTGRRTSCPRAAAHPVSFEKIHRRRLRLVAIDWARSSPDGFKRFFRRSIANELGLITLSVPPRC
jgi:hypothetical protein